eukprot:15470094-Alexandrium_andersonii.AAC.1
MGSSPPPPEALSWSPRRLFQWLFGHFKGCWGVLILKGADLFAAFEACFAGCEAASDFIPEALEGAILRH